MAHRPQGLIQWGCRGTMPLGPLWQIAPDFGPNAPWIWPKIHPGCPLTSSPQLQLSGSASGPIGCPINPWPASLAVVTRISYKQFQVLLEWRDIRIMGSWTFQGPGKEWTKLAPGEWVPHSDQGHYLVLAFQVLGRGARHLLYRCLAITFQTTTLPSKYQAHVVLDR